MTPFQVTEKDFEPDGRLLKPEGELDLAVADRLQAALDQAAADGRGAVIIDMAGCEFIDSTGIAVIMRAQSASLDRRVIVFGARGSVERVFSVTGLTENRNFVASAEEARALAGGTEPAI